MVTSLNPTALSKSGALSRRSARIGCAEFNKITSFGISGGTSSSTRGGSSLISTRMQFAALMKPADRRAPGL